MVKSHPAAFGWKTKHKAAFFSQIRHDIPEEMFRCLVRAIKSC
jgi:hypothetical protein